VETQVSGQVLASAALLPVKETPLRAELLNTWAWGPAWTVWGISSPLWRKYAVMNWKWYGSDRILIQCTILFLKWEN